MSFQVLISLEKNYEYNIQSFCAILKDI